MTTPSRYRRPHALATLVAGAAALLSTGCYDPATLLARVRNDAIKSRLEEIDLGEFHVTLPKDESNQEMTEVFLHVFGTSVRYRIATIEEKLSAEDHILKQAMIVALRKTQNEEFAEPRLTVLRTRMKDAINSVLGDTPIERIGFYNIRIARH